MKKPEKYTYVKIRINRIGQSHQEQTIHCYFGGNRIVKHELHGMLPGTRSGYWRETISLNPGVFSSSFPPLFTHKYNPLSSVNSCRQKLCIMMISHLPCPVVLMGLSVRLWGHSLWDGMTWLFGRHFAFLGFSRPSRRYCFSLVFKLASILIRQWV